MFCSASAQPTTSARDPHKCISIDTVSDKDVPFEGPIDTYPMGSHPRKSRDFQDVSGDLQLKHLRAYTTLENERIIMLDGSKCASRQGTQCAIRRVRDGVI